MATITRLEMGLHIVHDEATPTHIVAILRGYQRTFRVNGSLQRTADRARQWRATAIHHGIETADKAIADDVVTVAKAIVRGQSAIDAARNDVQRAMARYPISWDYDGYRNVFGDHVTKQLRAFR